MSSFVIFIISSLLIGFGYSGYFGKPYNELAFITGAILGILSVILFLITLVRLFVDEN